MGVEVVTFGCRLNAAEAQAIRRAAATAGAPDLVVINSCAVTAEAIRQIGQTIRRLKRERPDRRIIVTGCGAQVEPARFAAMPEVGAVLGNAAKTDPARWAALMRADAPRVDVPDIMAETTLAAPPAERAEGRTRGFLQVQNGCDHRCTFCIIPFGRGRSRSLPPSEALDQAVRLADAGHAEIVLTGVDITAYGADLPGAPTLGGLIRAILRAAPGLARLRLSSIDAVEADRDLMDAIAGEPRLMPHLHLSLQAGDDTVLKRMKRRHSRDDAVAFCREARRLRPDMAFSADLIAGFPTETEAMFARSLDLVDECGLSALHVFPFSPRPGTPAARMPQTPRDLIGDRAWRLRERGEAARRRHLDAMVGRRWRVLTERGGKGRAENFTPMRFHDAPEAGRLVEAVVTGHDGRELIASG